MHPWGGLPLQRQSRRKKEPRQTCPKWPLLWTGSKGPEVVIPVWALISTGPQAGQFTAVSKMERLIRASPQGNEK